MNPAPRAMVATSHPLAVRAALDVLTSGGNAVDAAVCAVAVLGVVEPMSTGIGGDCFAIVYEAKTGRLHGLNGSGRAPAAASIDVIRAAGRAAMPEDGILSVTVPGALHAWETLLARLGTRSLGALLDPAVRIARDGFAVTPIVARDWTAAEERLRRGTNTVDAWLPSGRAPRAGETFRAPDLARSLEALARDGVATFYEGVLADAIVAESRRLGSWIGLEDLASHRSTWVEALSANYRGATIWELPPNTQGVVVLRALERLERLPLATLSAGERVHEQIAAVRAAFLEARATIGDPDFGRGAQTVHAAVVDETGNAVSIINSLYHHFGANVVVAGTGITLQNRGALFSLDAGHPNALAPGKRPYHTILPAMATRDGRPWLAFGVVGGFMQPQGHVQVLSNLLDLGMDVQAAIAAPRFRWIDRADVALEGGTPGKLAADLVERGWRIVSQPPGFGFGAAQIVEMQSATSLRHGASDRRKDGCADGF